MNASHEHLHQPTTDPLWRESYYFNLLGSDLAAETTIGLRPHQSVAERLVLVYYRDQALVLIEPGPLAEFTPSALRATPVSYHCITPLERWHIHIAGQSLVLPLDEKQEIMSFVLKAHSGQAARRTPVVLDLDFQGMMPPYLYPSAVLDFLGSQTHHYEQVGQWTGTVQVGDDAIQQVTGLGVRDHSWGVRDWLQAEEWYWVNVLHPDEYLVLAYGRTGAEDWTGGGFIHTGGNTHPLSHIRVQAPCDDTTMLVGEAQVEVRTDDGRSFLASIHRQRGVQVIHARGPESLLRMSTNIGAAGDCAWMLQHGCREQIGTREA